MQEIKYSVKYDIPHLAHYPKQLFKCTISNFNEDIIYFNNAYSGCFYMLKTCDILEKGLLPILNSKYGYEHEIFTKTLTGKQYDLSISDELIELNKESINFCSGSKIDEKNINVMDKGKHKLTPYKEMKSLIIN